MDFSTLLAPVGVDRFMTEYFGKRPLHIPAASGRAPPLDWPCFNALLAIASHWSEGNLKLILNSRPIAPHFYFDEAVTLDGMVRRADPAKVEMFLAMGASLVANSVEQIAPDLRAVTDMLGDSLSALANANVYCSFTGVQGFATHFDAHEVFALQCEGEKTWRIYANRAQNLVEMPTGGEDVQRRIDAARGPLAMEVRMRPGDVLYLPRGVYHDALARDGASLHVTFSALPHSGRIVLQLLETAAMNDPAFQAYLPDLRGGGLPAHLAELGRRLSTIAASAGFRDRVVDAQRARVGRSHAVALPARPVLQSYARTDRRAEIRWSADGATLVTAIGQHRLGTAFAVAEYALSRPAFSRQELAARFAHVPIAERDALIALLERERLVEAYTPQLG